MSGNVAWREIRQNNERNELLDRFYYKAGEI